MVFHDRKNIRRIQKQWAKKMEIIQFSCAKLWKIHHVEWSHFWWKESKETRIQYRCTLFIQSSTALPKLLCRILLLRYLEYRLIDLKCLGEWWSINKYIGKDESDWQYKIKYLLIIKPQIACIPWSLCWSIYSWEFSRKNPNANQSKS